MYVYVHICICEYISGGSAVKDPTCQNRRRKGLRFNCWVRKIPWRRKWLPTLVFLPGEFRGQRSLTGHSPCGSKESDITEQACKHTSTCRELHIEIDVVIVKYFF